MKCEDILDDRHWRVVNYKQRIKAKDWQTILLNYKDEIIFRGNMTKLIAKDIGFGVYEISKQIEEGKKE